MNVIEELRFLGKFEKKKFGEGSGGGGVWVGRGGGWVGGGVRVDVNKKLEVF